MNSNATDTGNNTSHQAVVPFYAYAALFFLIGTILLFTSSGSFSGHYFHPHLLTITHTMALGWGTMMILGASYQLVPVLIEGSLYSEKLAKISFWTAAAGIPLLLGGFYFFNLGWPAISGGILINLALLNYLFNLSRTIAKSKKENIHAIYIFTATIWLLMTCLAGLLLVINFTMNILPADSLSYLSLHAHLGMGGWFLLLIIGVGSRLIPMFLISKYENSPLLWIIFVLVNLALALFVINHLYIQKTYWYFIPALLVFAAVLLFIFYINNAYRQRIRKKLDEAMKINMGSVLVMVLPLILIFIILTLIVLSGENSKLILLYGFIVFFGWISSLIIGMTFKTLPFIVWNKVYHNRQVAAAVPNPKDLYHAGVFRWMGMLYVGGFLVFITGILFSQVWILQSGSALLVCAALLYNRNVFKMLLHK